MTDRPDVISAKVERLLSILDDGQDLKRSSGTSVDEARKAQRDAVADVRDAGGSVSEVESIPLPSERV